MMFINYFLCFFWSEGKKKKKEVEVCIFLYLLKQALKIFLYEKIIKKYNTNKDTFSITIFFFLIYKNFKNILVEIKQTTNQKMKTKDKI